MKHGFVELRVSPREALWLYTILSLALFTFLFAS
jgi:hypothetical protein